MTDATTKTVSPLSERLASCTPGARMAEYRGMAAIASFGDADTEFETITTGCGVYDLSWRAKIAVTGQDRTRWLNNMLSNNIKDLPLNHGNYNFVLSPQGRILADACAYHRGEYILLDTDRSQIETLLKTIEHYIIMDDVELTDVSGKIAAIGVQGPENLATLKAAGIEAGGLEPMTVCDTVWRDAGISIVRTADQTADKVAIYEVWASTENLAAVFEALLAAGAQPAGSEALEKFRVLAGIPLCGRDIRDRDLPQETGQDRALNFTKGCYIGQEVVERIRSRGNVHRSFTGFILESGGGITPGAKIFENEKEVGTLTSVQRVNIAGVERLLALGYIRRETGKPGNRVEIKEGESSVPALVAALPFKF